MTSLESYILVVYKVHWCYWPVPTDVLWADQPMPWLDRNYLGPFLNVAISYFLKYVWTITTLHNGQFCSRKWHVSWGGKSSLCIIIVHNFAKILIKILKFFNSKWNCARTKIAIKTNNTLYCICLCPPLLQFGFEEDLAENHLSYIYK